MNEIGLVETISALRAELAEAVENGRDTDIQFPVTGVEIEFHVGVTRGGEGNAGVKFWVVELGGSASLQQESVQTVTITLGAPVDRSGVPIRVTSMTSEGP
ncbi:trypco2 family protein [Microbacterium sp. E-13]|uniref:trypco2 family protein n=1 Tax=Microbacterium sp. E-13 TaxID=3404048 RepID=UPI003CF58362